MEKLYKVTSLTRAWKRVFLINRPGRSCRVRVLVSVPIFTYNVSKFGSHFCVNKPVLIV